MSLTKVSYSMITGASINPLDYGAVGDGVVDDTAAIQSALDAGLAIDFGASEYIYKVSDELTVQSGSFLFANGATIRQVTDATSIFNIVGKTDIHIEGIVFDDTGAGYVENDGNPHAPVFGGAGTNFVTVTKCKFTKVTYAAIRFLGSSVNTITDNVIIGPGASVLPKSTNKRCYAVLFDVGCEKFICSNNHITGVTAGIRIEGSSDGVCNSNSIYDIPGQHGFYIGAACNNITINGNTLTNIALQAIKVQAENGFANVTQMTVVGNTIVACDQGITFSNGAGASAQTAKIENSAIDSNVIRDVSSIAINVQNTQQAIIANNTVSSCGFNGINLSACSLVNVNANFITNCDLSGIRDQFACTSIRLLNNTIRNVAIDGTVGDRFGIFVQTIDNYIINGNVVSSSTGTMEHALFVAAGDQQNSTIENNYLSGSTAGSLRIASSSTNFSVFKNNSLLDATQAANSSALPVIASSATIVLPTQNDVIRITGTTNITGISANGHTEHRVTLLFDGVLTVVRGSNVYVASDFTTSASDTLTIICDGTNWYEVSRSAN